MTFFEEDFDILTIPQNKGKRAYTDKMEFWYKDGAMILFEGQLGFLKFRKSSHYDETAVDFVPMADDFKNNMDLNADRANDYLPFRKTYFEISTNEREQKNEYADLRELLSTMNL